MSKNTHYIVRVKKHDNPKPMEIEFVGDIDKKGIIAFYALEEPDVESYTIRIAGAPGFYGHKKTVTTKTASPGKHTEYRVRPKSGQSPGNKAGKAERQNIT